MYALDWSLDRLGAPQFGKPNTLPGSCTSWIQVNPTDLVVPPGEKREVRYTAKVPEGVQGTYRSVIFLENVPPPNVSGGRSIAINGRIGSILYLQVGPQSRDLLIEVPREHWAFGGNLASQQAPASSNFGR